MEQRKPSDTKSKPSTSVLMCWDIVKRTFHDEPWLTTFGGQVIPGRLLVKHEDYCCGLILKDGKIAALLLSSREDRGSSLWRLGFLCT